MGCYYSAAWNSFQLPQRYNCPSEQGGCVGPQRNKRLDPDIKSCIAWNILQLPQFLNDLIALRPNRESDFIWQKSKSQTWREKVNFPISGDACELSPPPLKWGTHSEEQRYVEQLKSHSTCLVRVNTRALNTHIWWRYYIWGIPLCQRFGKCIRPINLFR